MLLTITNLKNRARLHFDLFARVQFSFFKCFLLKKPKQPTRSWESLHLMISGERPTTKTSSICLWVGNTEEGEKPDPFFLNNFSLQTYKRAAGFDSERLFKTRGNNVCHRWNLLVFLKVNTTELFSNGNLLLGS